MAADEQPGRGFMAQRHLGAIDAEDARPSAGSSAGRSDFGTGNKAKLHEPARNAFGKIQALENTTLTVGQIGKCSSGGPLERSFGWLCQDIGLF